MTPVGANAILANVLMRTHGAPSVTTGATPHQVCDSRCRILA